MVQPASDKPPSRPTAPQNDTLTADARRLQTLSRATEARLPWHDGLPFSLLIRALEVAVEILVWADHQEFEHVLIQDPAGQQAQEIAHPEFLELHTCQVADFGFTGFGLAGDRAHGLVERGFLLAMQLFGRALEGGGDKDAHQPNWYSPAGSS